ncbi:hypothetical protein F0U60_09875 [Archangium minus]|uniref:DUF3108 domain-containing protein n=1 Tax=Archangium minus TaxID=83450 RepID=A0ABY9WKT2_9BACT|nr:hypothetical protein F0U60_09875 [Archangium minus]
MPSIFMDMGQTLRRTSRRSQGALLISLGLLLGLASPAWAVELLYPERNATRELAVSTPEGQPLGKGSLTQWTEGERLHVLLTYRYDDGRIIEESAVFLTQPELVQERWNWRERKEGQTTRQFTFDFGSGRAVGLTREGGKTRRYTEQLKVEPGRTFAGVGFALVAKNLLPQLRQGEEVKLQALAATPKPRKVNVKLSREGTESLTLAGQTLTADRVVIHPEIGLASLVVKAPDTNLYFTGSGPPVMVGGEGPVLEPGDPVVRTELLPQRRAPAAARRQTSPNR